MINKEEYIKPIHPGEVLFEDFMKPLNISQNKLANCIGVPTRRINEIVHGKRAITADTAIRLGRFFGTSAQVWIGLQAEYDLDMVLYIDRTQDKKSFDFIQQYDMSVSMA